MILLLRSLSSTIPTKLPCRLRLQMCAYKHRVLRTMESQKPVLSYSLFPASSCFLFSNATMSAALCPAPLRGSDAISNFHHHARSGSAITRHPAPARLERGSYHRRIMGQAPGTQPRRNTHPHWEPA